MVPLYYLYKPLKKPLKKNKQTQTLISLKQGCFCSDHFAQLKAHLCKIIILKTIFKNNNNQDQLEEQSSGLCPTPREHRAIAVLAYDLPE